jgi:signal peptidase I
MFKKFLIASLAFMLGLVASIAFMGINSVEIPAITDHSPVLQDGVLKAKERISPFDWVKESDIGVYEDGVTISVDNPQWAVFADTNSMDPVFDSNSHAIEIIPKTAEDVHVGDIASYSTDNGTIIHRVIETGYDREGWYAMFKGDNNPAKDPEKVRFNDIRRIVVAIIY